MECLKHQGFISAKKTFIFTTFVGEKLTAQRELDSQFKLLSNY